jgi:2-keto-4-pentenoate hydratase/2-oxohepta-3-ene-1,7-dioic acid hydratase in catechol pathway
MRIAVFDDYRVGTVESDGIHDLTDLIQGVPAFAAELRINELIAQFERLRPLIEARRTAPGAIDPSTVRWRAPVARPHNFLAAPLNFAAHGAEVASVGVTTTATARELGFFVKAGGSISGPTDPIELPDLPDRRFDHEGEVAVVIGRPGRAIARGSALDHVFGYMLLVDVTMRMTATQREERPMRKSFHTFAPTGPWIVTADEIGDPSQLDIKLWVNDELRQSGRLSDLIVDVPDLIAHASTVVELRPGDVYSTGTPEGIGPIEVGDVVRVESGAIGTMTIPVVRRSW